MMVVVLTGMTRFPFQRLLNLVKNMAKKKPDWQFWVQKGKGCLQTTKNIKVENFALFGEVQKKIKQADIVITHGGPASIFLCLKAGKKPCVLARSKQWKEQVNDHQVVFVDYLEKEGRVFKLKDGEWPSIYSIRAMKALVNKPQQKLINKLTSYLDSLC